MKKYFILIFLLYCCPAYTGEFQDVASYGLEFGTLLHVMEDETQEDSQPSITIASLLEELFSEKNITHFKEKCKIWHSSYKKWIYQDPKELEDEAFFLFLPLWFLR